MNYYCYKCTFSNPVEEYILDLLVSDLTELGFEGFEYLESGVKAYIQSSLVSNTLASEINKLGYENLIIEYYELENKNWNAVWEKNFSPKYIENCYLRADFHPKPEKHVDYDIIITPKMSFGTGHHATTELMVKYCLNHDFSGKTVLDMGTGTGILAILANMKNADNVTAIDNDEWSYKNAIENIANNNIKNINIIKGDAQNIPQQKYDIIFANINKNVLLNDIGKYTLFLKTTGILFLSGFYQSDIHDIDTEAKVHELLLKEKLTLGDWVALKYIKH